MNQIPIGPNQLGLRNSQQQYGYFLIASGALVAIAAAIRIMTADDLREFLMLAAVIAAVPFALRRLYTGACIALSVVIDVVGPAGFEKSSSNLRGFLLDRLIWTYERPAGLLGQLYYRFIPELVFVTPPYRGIVAGALMHLFLLIVVISCAVYFGGIWLWFVAVIFIAAVGRIVALKFLLAGHEKGIPPIDVHESRKHLTSAGNPADLFNHLRVVFEDLREGNFQNRVIEDQPPPVGLNSSSNNFTANLMIETQPMPIEGKQRLKTLLTLATCAVLLEAGGFCILLFRPEITQGELLEHLVLSAAGVAAILYGSKFFLIAQRIHFAFRFRSDIIWLNFSGSYVVNKISVGGGLSGLPGTEGQTVKSDIHVFIRGARLISECMPRSHSVWDQIVGSTRPAEDTLQNSPRYLVSSGTDSVFTERLDRITKNTSGFKDTANTLRTPNLYDESMQDMLGASAQINQMLHASGALGIAQGQAASLQGPNQPVLPLTGSIGGQSQQPRTRVPPVKSQGAPPRQQKRVGPPPPPPPPGGKKRSAIRWKCSNCNHDLSSTKSMVGKQVKCSNCSKFENVPSS